VTDVGVQALAAGCAGLEMVWLDGCTGVTDVGAQALAAGCAGLEMVGLNGCTGVSRKYRKYLGREEVAALRR
jgi:hypothetical protein